MEIRTFILPLIAGVGIGSAAFAGVPDSKSSFPITESEPQPWRFSMALPGWIPWQSGDVGINGTTAHLKLGPNDIIPKLDMVLTVRAEAHKGRFGVMGEYGYLSLSDGVGTPGLVKKLDVRTDQHLGELAVSWRLVEGERGWLDGFAGVRYTNLYQALGIHPDDNAIESASRGFVDTIAGRIASGVSEKVSQLIEQRLTSKLTSLQDRDPVLPEGPIGDAIRQRAAQRVQAIVAQRQAELRAAIQSQVPSRVDEAKARLSRAIAGALKDTLNTRVTRTDDWWDPFVGLRGRYYLSKAVYLTGRADIGGFGVGSDLAWQVNAGIGCQLARNVFTETTYRLYDVNYRRDGLTYDVLTHGIELTLGVNF